MSQIHVQISKHGLTCTSERVVLVSSGHPPDPDVKSRSVVPVAITTDGPAAAEERAAGAYLVSAIRKKSTQKSQPVEAKNLNQLKLKISTG